MRDPLSSEVRKAFWHVSRTRFVSRGISHPAEGASFQGLETRPLRAGRRRSSTANCASLFLVPAGVAPPWSAGRRLSLCPQRNLPVGKKRPALSYSLKAGHITWQRPTLTEPIALLPLALHRFTAVFGMGTGGSNALWSPGAGFGGLLQGL